MINSMKFSKKQVISIHLFCLFLGTACNSAQLNSTAVKTEQGLSEREDDGYKELENPDSIQSFGASDYHTDNPKMENIRPKESILKTHLDTNLLFGIWTVDPEGPHADFHLTKKSFYVVDYDGDGDLLYELQGRKIKIYYKDVVQQGKIISVSQYSLHIQWKDAETIQQYVRWPMNDHKENSN